MQVVLLPLAVVFDYVIGDPRSSWHPVVLIGKIISWLESKLLQPTAAGSIKKINGGILVAVVLCVTYGLVWLLTLVTEQFNIWFSIAVQALLLSFTISPRSLKAAGQEIQGYLEAGDMANARYKVGWIVGRDTENLDSAEVTRATVETVAENIVDGIISPLFYAAIGGVPLAYLYRAVNTMDSMVGYKNEKYIDFGMPAARIDDIFNYIPARITGLLIMMAVWPLGFSAKGAFKSMARDAVKHPSPNSGFAEAGVAGALGIRLGGINYYGGVRSVRAFMGDALHATEPKHIEQTAKIMYTVTILFIILIMACARLP